MNSDEKNWLEAAIDVCKRGSEKGVLLVLIRNQDANDEGDYIVTNGNSDALAAAINSRREGDSGDE